MRLTSIFFRNARQPQNENKVPFKAMMPLVLKNYIHKSNQNTDRGCLLEIQLLLACLEENEYEDKNCIPQFNLVKECNERYIQNAKKNKINSGNIKPIPNSKNQTPAQITYLLRKYPTV